MSFPFAFCLFGAKFSTVAITGYTGVGFALDNRNLITSGYEFENIACGRQ